jgi:hypothetical protein
MNTDKKGRNLEIVKVRLLRAGWILFVAPMSERDLSNSNEEKVV